AAHGGGGEDAASEARRGGRGRDSGGRAAAAGWLRSPPPQGSTAPRSPRARRQRGRRDKTGVRAGVQEGGKKAAQARGDANKHTPDAEISAEAPVRRQQEAGASQKNRGRKRW
ncbi:unnamed protein product, partial [Prorocentrum cordatum]